MFLPPLGGMSWQIGVLTFVDAPGFHRSAPKSTADERGGNNTMHEDAIIGRKNLWRIGVAAAVAGLLIAVGFLASDAYASATIHGTKNHDWGKADKGMLADPAGCKKRCGKMIHGTGGSDTIYGHEGWDYIGTFGGSDVVYGGNGMEIIQGVGGNDRIYGEMGHDHVFGGPGNDTLHLEDGKDEPGDVEQVIGDKGRDFCVVDEDTRDGVVAHKSCERLKIVAVAGMNGGTKIFNTHHAKHRGAAARTVGPGTYRLN